MNVNPEEARDMLGQAEDAGARTRRMIAYGGGDVLFILWGVIWLIGFLGTHVFTSGWLVTGQAVGLATGVSWAVLVTIGVVTSIVHERSHMPVRSQAGAAVGIMWWLLYMYVWLWIGLLHPFIRVQGHEQSQQLFKHMGAIAATIPMFAYVIFGLFFERYMLWIGLVVTALTVLGVYLLQPYFWLWMAVTGGGTLIGAGIYARVRWRQR